VIINRANELRRYCPSLGLQDALLQAIKELTGAEQVVAVVDEKKPLPMPKLEQKRSKPPVPEHVKLNRERIRRAEQLRRETGGVLPAASFVSGGKISPK